MSWGTDSRPYRSVNGPEKCRVPISRVFGNKLDFLPLLLLERGGVVCRKIAGGCLGKPEFCAGENRTIHQ